MKLGVISTMAGAPWGGSEELWCALGQEALRQGHHVCVSVYYWKNRPGKIQKLSENGAKVEVRNRILYSDLKGKVKGKFIQFFLAEMQLKSFIQKNEPDVLLISLGALCELEIEPILSFIEKLNKPFYLVVHSNLANHVFPILKMRRIKVVLEKAQKVFFVSKRLIDQAERQLAIKFQNAKTVRNPVNMDSIGELPFPATDAVQFAVVGSLQVGVKGQALLLQVLSREIWKERNWSLSIYGKGPDEQLIKELIDFYELSDRVFLKGYVNDVRNEIWAQNHILLMPSYQEGLPIALIEAMLSGRASVVTDIGGVSEVLEDNVTGFVAEGVTPNSFGNALETAWQKKDNWQQMGKKAFIDAKKYFGENPIPDLLDQIIVTK